MRLLLGIGEAQQTGMSIAWFGLAVVEGQFSSSFIDFPWILCVLHTPPFLECNMTSCQWKCSNTAYYSTYFLHVFIFSLH